MYILIIISLCNLKFYFFIIFYVSGYINISYNSEKQHLQFAIQDTGIGMSEREVERVFKPFEQADATTTRRFGGTGLGLCISKNLAQLLGGDVQLISEPGNGSCFTIASAEM